MYTFEVDLVESDATYAQLSGVQTPDELKSFLSTEASNAGMLPSSIEAFKCNTANTRFLGFRRNAFVETALNAYSQHMPITFGPDEIWLLIAQAISTYIEENAEAVRHVIVPFEGKKTLTVKNSDFVKGDPNNPWERDFGRFGDQIEKYLGKKRNLFDPTFSTTGPTEKAVIQVRMMTALSPFFAYRMMTECGVPHITLLGMVEDWEGIQSRVNGFKEFAPSWLTAPLEFAVQNFVEAAKGNPDLPFWQNFFKIGMGSGGTPVGGLMNCLFPYLANKQRNRCLDGDFKSHFLVETKSGYDIGPSNEVGDFGSTVGHVPMLWLYYGQEFRMRLASGVVGMAIENGSYRCSIGWFVGEDAEHKDEE